MKTKLRPHKVLGQTSPKGELHALTWTTGEFAGIVFSYEDVNFVEKPDEDNVTLSYGYTLYEVPEDLKGFNKSKFETELGDFMVQLLYYGLEKDKLGYIDDEQNREDNPVESNAQRGVLP
jgi:hypothetical protein